ncbi:MAG: hypothetical protein JXR97_07610, partial [Planctomycetes bacterium]|nr:hypothetical protein [Planctomycetota bacterium]
MVCETPFVQTITMYNDFDEIGIENELDWEGPRWIRLQQVFPYPAENSEICYGVPYGQVKFPETLGELSKTGEDEIDPELRASLRLCRHWVDAGTDDCGMTVAADHRMWEFEDGMLRSYMLRGIGFCGVEAKTGDREYDNVARPPAGKYNFRYIVRPRNGSLAETSSYRCGWELNHPTRQVAVSYGNPEGRFPASQGLLDFSESSTVVTALKNAEEKEGLVLRAFETTGEESKTAIPQSIPGKPVETNILEKEYGKVDGREIAFKPFEIKTILFTEE